MQSSRIDPGYTLWVLLASCPLSVAGVAAEPVTTASCGPLAILGRDVPPGARRKFSYQTTPTFEGAFLDTAVLVARGAHRVLLGVSAASVPTSQASHAQRGVQPPARAKIAPERVLSAPDRVRVQREATDSGR